jgi:hypothetical protein
MFRKFNFNLPQVSTLFPYKECPQKSLANNHMSGKFVKKDSVAEKESSFQDYKSQLSNNVAILMIGP